MHTRMLCRFYCVVVFSTVWTVAARLLCPRDSPGKNTGVGCQALLQGSSCIAGGFLIAEPPGKPRLQRGLNINAPRLFTAALYWPLARFCSLRSPSPKKESRLGPCQPVLNQSPMPSTHTDTHNAHIEAR